MKKQPQIEWVTYGKSTLTENLIFQGGSKDARRPIVFGLYLIRWGERNILIDAGCDSLPGFEMTDLISPAQAVEKLGINATQVTDVVITHAHHDHIQGLHHFPHATVYIQQDEYTAGKKHIPSTCRVCTFSERCMVADCLEVEKIGGHSKGSCIAKMHIDGACYVFCGDECYLRECLTRRIPTGGSCNPEKSLEFIQKYSDPTYHVLLSHDPERQDGTVVSAKCDQA